MLACEIVRRTHMTLAAVMYCALAPIAIAQQTAKDPASDAGRDVLQLATEHMQELSMRLVDGEDDVELVDRPLLTYGDSARANKNGTLWAFGKSGRPLAVLELYQGLEANA